MRVSAAVVSLLNRCGLTLVMQSNHKEQMRIKKRIYCAESHQRVTRLEHPRSLAPIHRCHKESHEDAAKITFNLLRSEALLSQSRNRLSTQEVFPDSLFNLQQFLLAKRDRSPRSVTAIRPKCITRHRVCKFTNATQLLA